MKAAIKILLETAALFFFARAAYLAVKILVTAWKERHGRKEG